MRPARRIRGSVRYSTDERGSPGPFGSDPGGTYGGIDTISRGINDRWLMSVSGAVPAGRARISGRGDALAARQRVREPVRRFRVVFAPHDRAGAGRRDARPGLETSAGVEFLGERAGEHVHHRDRATSLVPVERGIAGFFGEARWNHAGARCS